MILNQCICAGEPLWMKDKIAKIDDSILDKFYGCGFPITEAVEGCTVLDLGCGSGRDVYIYSQMVGEGGKVIGVDMTESQLEQPEMLKNFRWRNLVIQKAMLSLKGILRNSVN